MAMQMTENQRAPRLREKLRADRDRGDNRWRTYSTAARIEALQEAGVPWKRILNQNDDFVAAARSILENEAGNS